MTNYKLMALSTCAWSTRSLNSDYLTKSFNALYWKASIQSN